MYKKKIRTLKIIAFSLIAGVIIFTIIVYTGTSTHQPTTKDEMSYILAGVVVLAMLASFFLGRNQIAKIQDSESVTQRIEKYQTALILRLAPLEGAAFLAGVICYD